MRVRPQFFTRETFWEIPQLQRLAPDTVEAMHAVAQVLPFRVNRYVLDELIDWDRVPDDPMFQLCFPQPGMLEPLALSQMCQVLRKNLGAFGVRALAWHIRQSLNPHPAGQMSLNVPTHRGRPLVGVQHKYPETVLFFPEQGQTCHTYCSYCFRWPQFVGMNDLKMANREVETLIDYVREHPLVENVLFTGGDPMIMRTQVLRRYVEPLLQARLPNLRAIRFGSKAPAFWPYRFTADGDEDADDLLRLFSDIVAAGLHLAVMVHYSHPRELETAVAKEAVRRIRATGAVVRSQAPLIRHVNDDAPTWAALWSTQVQQGIVPYYMFVERDTGPKNYFEVPLYRALEIYNDAQRRLAGLARSARGPSMSATPGKILVDGVTELEGRKMFVLKMIQAREPDWVGRVFFARYDERATWIDELEPFGEKRFFYEKPHKMPIRPRGRARLRVLGSTGGVT